jgi:hypothetical protein
MARTTTRTDQGTVGQTELPAGFRVKSGDDGSQGSAGGSESVLDGSEGDNRELEGGNVGNEGEGFDPAAAAGEPKPKKRGRPPGSGKQGTGEKAERPSSGRLDLNLLRDQILIVHAVAAQTLNCPELQLTEDEAKRLGASLNSVAKQFDIGQVVNPKVQAILGLVTVAGMIYAPRAPAIIAAVKSRTKKPKQEIITPSGEVFQG